MRYILKLLLQKMCIMKIICVPVPRQLIENKLAQFLVPSAAAWAALFAQPQTDLRLSHVKGHGFHKPQRGAWIAVKEKGGDTE